MLVAQLGTLTESEMARLRTNLLRLSAGRVTHIASLFVGSDVVSLCLATLTDRVAQGEAQVRHLFQF